MAADKTSAPPARRPAAVKPAAARPQTTKPAGAKPAAARPPAGPATAKPAAPATPASQDRVGLREREAIRVFALASDHHRNGRLDDAIRGYARALALNPNIPDAYNNMGVALRALGKLEAAIACYQRSLSMRPKNAGVYSNMGNALRELGRLEAAAASLQQAIRLAPGNPEAVYNLGLVLRDIGQPDKAMQCFDAVLKARPDHVECRWDRALSLLLEGDYQKGFAEYEWRWKLRRSPPRGFKQPLWDGKPFQGKTLLLHHEQGYGDMIQFIRYVPMVKKLGGTVIVECQAELARLFATLDGIDKVVIRGAPLPKFDVYAPLLTLAKIMGTTIKTVPTAVPYLKPPELRTVHLPVVDRRQFKVGIAWAGRPTHRNDRNRSCPFTHFAELMGLPNVTFFSLQKGDATEDLRKYACDALVMDVGQQLEDFADTAAVLQQLDLVICVDTAVAHLAGALARPVWVVLPQAGDWRWMRDGETTPWYPTMRLFRQKTRSDWDDVFAAVRQRLRDAIVEHVKKAGA